MHNYNHVYGTSKHSLTPIINTGIDVNTFKEDFPMSPKNGTYRYLNNRSQIHGRKISVNGKEIALFCYGDTFYAMDEKCPHLGLLTV